MAKEIVKRPGRKLGAAKREAARDILTKFALTKEFNDLPRNVKVAIFTLSPQTKAAYDEKVERDNSFLEGNEKRGEVRHHEFV